MDMEILGTLSGCGLIISLGNIPGTSADGTSLAGSSRDPWLLGGPPARDPQRYRNVALAPAGGTTMA